MLLLDLLVGRLVLDLTGESGFKNAEDNRKDYVHTHNVSKEYGEEEGVFIERV